VDIEEIGARLEIQDALMRYARGVDRGDKDLICSAYFPDAHDDHGPFVGTPDDLAAMLVRDMDATGMIGQHLMLNSLIELDGHKANVETYWLVIHPDTTGLIWAGGRYLDASNAATASGGSPSDACWSIGAAQPTIHHRTPGPWLPTSRQAAGGSRTHRPASSRQCPEPHGSERTRLSARDRA
jgi:hypothetical protein